MLRTELIHAVNKVNSALDNAHVVNALRSQGEKTIPSIITAYSHFKSLFEPASDAEKAIIAIFELEPLFSADWWAIILGSGKQEEGPQRERMMMIRKLNFVHDTLPRIAMLLEHGREDRAPEH